MEKRFADRTCPPGRKQDGYALIEMMIAILIITISVVALYEMLAQGSSMMAEQRHRRLALEKAQSHIETMQFWAAKVDTIPRSLAGKFREYLLQGGDSGEQDIPAEYTIVITHSLEVNKKGMPIYSDVSIEYKWTEPSTSIDDALTLRARF